MTPKDEPAQPPGISWSPNGSATLSGPLLSYAELLEARFFGLSRRWSAMPVRFPPVISAIDLDRIDYFASFPQLATFAACLDAGDENLEAFRSGEPVGPNGQLQLTQLAPVADVLTPAACYPIYIAYAGQRFTGPRYFTTSSTCFRREAAYVPLERQWSFTMREIVCIGGPDEVREFVDAVTADIDALLTELGLALPWVPATDPFFRPTQNPRSVMQLVDPTKHELTFDGRLAIASANLHRDAFGRAYDIEHEEGQTAHSACVALGLERWLAALLQQFGDDPSVWPDIHP